MTRFRRAVAACVCALAVIVAGTAGATAGMKPQKVSGKVELVNMGKHAFSLTALNMQLIYVTSKTKFTGIKNLDAIKKGQTIHATVLHVGKKYDAVTISDM
jgi:alpha-L-fucosidase